MVDGGRSVGQGSDLNLRISKVKTGSVHFLLIFFFLESPKKTQLHQLTFRTFEKVFRRCCSLHSRLCFVSCMFSIVGLGSFRTACQRQVLGGN